jgi:hypothetical protein
MPDANTVNDGKPGPGPGPLLMFSLNYINGFMVGESEEVRRHWKRIYAHLYTAPSGIEADEPCSAGRVGGTDAS